MFVKLSETNHTYVYLKKRNISMVLHPISVICALKHKQCPHTFLTLPHQPKTTAEDVSKHTRHSVGSLLDCNIKRHSAALMLRLLMLSCRSSQGPRNSLLTLFIQLKMRIATLEILLYIIKEETTNKMSALLAHHHPLHHWSHTRVTYCCPHHGSC